MTMGNRAAERYFQQVKSWIPCAGKMKKDVLTQIWDEIGGYLEENPDAGEADLRQRFGTPQQIAVAYVGEVDGSELLRNLRLRRRIARIVAGAAIAATLMWAVAVTFALVKYDNAANGYWGEEIAVISDVPLEGRKQE